MTPNKLYRNPTVKTVIFQITFPNLFFIESRIGDFQIQIMKEFPKSNLLLEQKLVFASGIVGAQQANLNEQEAQCVKKIWQFISDKGYELKLTTDSLSIISTLHKSYENPAAEHRFRDVIQLCVDSFLDISKIPMVSRIGLRYIDECPVPEPLNNDTYMKWYKSTFPLRRFDVSGIGSMQVVIQTSRGAHGLTFAERIIKDEQGNIALTLDFDGHTCNIEAKNYLGVCDSMHKMIADEFEGSIKKPVRDIMNTQRGV